MPPARFYMTNSPEQPWGDYGSILWSGMTGHLPRRQGKLQLERTGPFCPAIFESGGGDWIVRAPLKRAFVQAGFEGVRFESVLKARIVRLHWEKWDQSNEDEPPVEPSDFEPEGYILGRKHSPTLARQMGPFYELCVPVTAQVIRKSRIVASPRELRLTRNSVRGRHFFRAEGVGVLYVSDTGKNWLEEHAPRTVVFEEAMTV